MLDKNFIYHGDCLEWMTHINDKSIDMILCDLPYGTTACKWDTIIPFNKLWKQYERIIKDNGAIVLFGSEPFSSYLRLSNINLYKYDYVWIKTKAGNFQQARKLPMKKHETISVFYKNYPIFNLWNLKLLDKPIKSSRKNKGSNLSHCTDKGDYFQKETGFHFSDLYFSNGSGKGYSFHPTQKPVALCEYLIKTYTNEDELVLDNCIGSGTTAIACLNTNRNYIGIEKELKYVQISNQRIQSMLRQG